jgi:hypothetical protein
MFLVDGILLVLCALTGLRVLVLIVPADLSENTLFLEHMIPVLALMKKKGLVRPLTLAADAGFRGDDVSKALLDIGIDPRIHQVGRKQRWTGREHDTSVVTRARPSGGRRFRDLEVVRFEAGPRAQKGPFLGPRGGVEKGKKRRQSGFQRTPLSPREHPNVKRCHIRRGAAIKRWRTSRVSSRACERSIACCDPADTLR